MLNFLGQRLLQLIPVLWGVATLVFLLIHFVPGDPVEIMLGENASTANKIALREQLNLQKPLSAQYFDFWDNIFHGNLGKSLLTKVSVSKLILERIPATASLALLAICFALLFAIPTGVYCAVYENSILDHFFMGFCLLFVSMPSFWLATLLVIAFSIHLGWFPVSERSDFSSYILPALTLGFSMSAILSRMTRAGVIDVLRQEYIITAHAKGLSNKIIYFKHALKNAAIPVITILGLQLGSLLAGTVITETIFDWPGIGELLYRAIQARDYPLVQGCVLVIAIIYVFANTLADIGYTIANPKITLE